MRRVPSCLPFAAFILSLGLVTPDGASAQTGVRHSPPSQHVAGSRRPHFTRPLPRIERRHGMAHRHRHWRHFNAHGKHRHGFIPHRPRFWPYVETAGDPTTIIFEQGEAPVPHRVLTGIPSVADLQISAGIRSAPSASPTIYVLNGRRSLRRSGAAKIVTIGEGEAEAELQNSGPRIIHLNVPQGR